MTMTSQTEDLDRALDILTDNSWARHSVGMITDIIIRIFTEPIGINSLTMIQKIILYTTLCTVLISCGDTGCVYERYIQIERSSQGLIKYLDCIEETCPGLPHKKTCRVT
jgi:hypothetical protein